MTAKDQVLIPSSEKHTAVPELTGHLESLFHRKDRVSN